MCSRKAITQLPSETWWDGQHNWSAAMDGCNSSDRKGKEAEAVGVAPYIRECFDYLQFDDDNKRVYR